MNELQQKIDDATNRITQINKEIVDHQSTADALEVEARAHRKAAHDLKMERESLNKVLGHTQVANSAMQAEAAAKKAQTEAEANSAEVKATLDRLNEKEKNLDDLITKAAAAVEKKPE